MNKIEVLCYRHYKILCQNDKFLLMTSFSCLLYVLPPSISFTNILSNNKL